MKPALAGYFIKTHLGEDTRRRSEQKLERKRDARWEDRADEARLGPSITVHRNIKVDQRIEIILEKERERVGARFP